MPEETPGQKAPVSDTDHLTPADLLYFRTILKEFTGAVLGNPPEDSRDGWLVAVYQAVEPKAKDAMKRHGAVSQKKEPEHGGLPKNFPRAYPHN
jgi:hypothetical protein